MLRFGHRKLHSDALSLLLTRCYRLYAQGSVFVYDPVFTEADKEFLQGLGMQCLPDTASHF